MTGGTDRKRHLLKRYPGCWQNEYPQGVNVHIQDHMPDVKYKGAHITTVQVGGGVPSCFVLLFVTHICGRR